MELNSLLFEGNACSHLFSFPGSREDTSTRGLIRSLCTCNSCKKRFDSALRLYDAGGTDKRDVLSASFRVRFDFAAKELSANAFERSTELSERTEREEEEEGEEDEDEIGFFKGTWRGFVMTVLGGGPCLKCPLHAGLKLSKLRTGFN